jgi:flagellar motility protein MotE (MotC chaperone)
MKVLKLDDQGLLEKFFDKQIKNLQRNIKVAKQNIEATTTNFENDKDELKDQIEDAEENVILAYTNIDPDQLKSNGSISIYEDIYWSNINRAEQNVEKLKGILENKASEYEQQIENYKEKIKKFEKTINVIKNFKK